jgi:hypothetical protein
MSETWSGSVAAIRVTGDLLGEAGQHLPAVDPGAIAFGAGGPGRLGDVGRDLYLQWQRALDARAREAQSHAARVHDLADLAGHAAGGFADADQSAHSHQADQSGDAGPNPGVM